MDKSAPSKESLERAHRFFNETLSGENGGKHIRDILALEFDAIARERDEVTEKLEEFLEKLNGKIQTAGAERILAKNFGELAIYFSGDEIRAMRKALAASAKGWDDEHNL